MQTQSVPTTRRRPSAKSATNDSSLTMACAASTPTRRSLDSFTSPSPSTSPEKRKLAFYDFPAEHWAHLRTTNPIESTFSTVKLRTKVTRGAGSPAAALAMVFKLVESAQERWRAITGAHLVALVRSGAKFENGFLVERDETVAA
jgi:Transposase, Mutator family